MFKYYYDSPKEESVYNLVDNNGSERKGNYKKYDNNKRYRSVHSNMVREEVVKNKMWPAKTMGLPRLPVEGPEMFLRKQSKRPLSVRPKSVSGGFISLMPREKGCQTDEQEKEGLIDQNATQEKSIQAKEPDENNATLMAKPTNEKIRPQTCFNRVCLSSKKKPPIPGSKLGVNIVVEDTKDFIKTNAVTAISTRPQKPKDPIVYVDTPKGDTREWINSGLAPHYIHKKKFAHVPVYITLRKKEFLDQLKKQQDEEQIKTENSQVRILEKDQRDEMIEGLKQNWTQIFSNYQRLPLLIDTPGKIKRKTSMEAQLKKLEEDIQTLQRHDSIYVSDLAPHSFYAFSIEGRRKQKK